MSEQTPASPGRRRTTGDGPTRRPGPAALAAVAVVVLAAVAVGLTPGGADPTTRTAPRTGTTVDHTLLACPDLPPGRRVDTTAALGLAPRAADERLGDGGEVQVGPIGGTTRSVRLARGALTDVSATAGPRVEATGAAAAGLFGFRTDTDRPDTLGVATCPAPRAQWWFAGAGASLDHSSVLDVANVDPGPAVLDVRVLGPDGEVQTVGTEGITVAPDTRQQIDLTEIAPQGDELAVSVHATRGRVVASLRDGFSPRAGAPTGQEWLPSLEAPTRTLRLAGLPAQARSRTLLVANPGDLEALVKVQVAGADGTFAPTGLDAVSVAPGSAQSLDLDRVLTRTEAVSLRITSQVPVVATARSTSRTDLSYAAPVTALVGPAAAPLPARSAATVALSAGATAATATLTAYDGSGGRVGGTTLDVPATGTATWSPPSGASYLVVVPGDGRVLGAVTYDQRRGTGIATVPLEALPVALFRPGVRPALH